LLHLSRVKHHKRFRFLILSNSRTLSHRLVI
jgi:hypothetical protein